MILRRNHLIAILIALSSSSGVAEPVVNEIMALNRATLADPQGEYDDWVEIHNPDSTDLDLRGYYFSDEADDRTKWMISGELPVLVPAAGYALLWLDNDPEAGANHLPFRLRSEGDFFSLTAPDGVTVIEQIVLPLQHPDISYGRSHDHGGQLRYLIKPTPGEANDPLGVDQLEGITFSRSQGVFVDAFQLTLATSSDGASIRYTLDGAAPTSSTGQLYGAPLDIGETTCLRAALFLGTRQISPVETRIFLAVEESLFDFDSGLPIVLLDSQGYDFANDSAPRTDYPAQAVCAGFFEPAGGALSVVADRPQFIGRAGMNVRGASSKRWPKKQFKFETWDEDDSDRDVPLLGMPQDSDWILHAPYFDKSLMRNQCIYHWWGQLGYYSPRTRFVEVFLNPNPSQPFSLDHYQGIYLLVEKIKRSPDRMDVARLETDDVAEPEVTGGYIAQSTNINQDWTSGESTRYKYVEPSKDDPLPIQKSWLRNFVEAAESSVYADNFDDPTDGYSKYLDLSSQIDYDIMRELSRNADGASTFFSIERGGKLKMGPLWDYNQALGLSSLGDASLGYSWDTGGWNRFYMRANTWLGWWDRLDDDPNYQLAWNDRWVSLRESTLSTAQLLGHIDSVATLLEEAQVRNFEKWDILGAAVWVVNGSNRADAGEAGRDTYAKEVSYLRNWVDGRLQWIDSQVPSPPEFSQNGGAVATGFSLEMSEGVAFRPFAGDVYYTIDGTDPAAPGVVPMLYEGPVILNGSVQIMARTRSTVDSSWGTLRDAIFSVGAQPPTAAGLTISEIHYNPDGADDLEFIELANRGSSNINLTGLRFTTAVEFEFGAHDLMPGETVLVVEDEDAFRAAFATPGSPRYVEGIFIAGQWSGRLSNVGETIELLDPTGDPIHSLAYGQDGDWPSGADGDGFTLQQRELASDPSVAANWRLSSFEDGTPGSVPSADTLTAEGWRVMKFTAAQLTQPEISGLLSDPDRDGLSNLLEFGLARLPLVAEARPPVQIAIEMVEVAGVLAPFLTLTFDRPTDSELQYVIEKSSDLSEWKTRPLIHVRSSVNLESQIETITVREKQPIAKTGQGSRIYVRIQIAR